MKDHQIPAPPTVHRSPVNTMLLPLMAMAITLVTTPLLAVETSKDPKYLRQLGTNYELGKGVRRNYRRAYRLYCMAAVKGDAEANYHLGWMYFNGRGIPRNTQKAAYWFKQGAIRGDQTAKNMLGLLANTKRRKDNTCANLSRGREADRTQIEAWAYELAPEYDLEPELVLAVIKEESNFNPKAWSHKDARGLMQLLPATARRFKVNNTWDPVDNMRGGMAYLQWLLRHFNGDVQLVLAAYNAGENAVKRHKGIPPYKETIGYVRRITQIYPKSILPTPAAPPDTAKK
ncbi:MAG: transglycosylase SLT domain-containing protein [Gammaproteobacteria bacterium]|nr:transglycosylase SLT domain-containing protein [Gammaproteobacteria bacterium]